MILLTMTIVSDIFSIDVRSRLYERTFWITFTSAFWCTFCST